MYPFELLKWSGHTSLKAKMNFHLLYIFSVKEEVKRVGRKVKEDVGDVTILVNNAGIVSGTKLINTPDHMVEKVFNVNLLGQFWVSKWFKLTFPGLNH